MFEWVPHFWLIIAAGIVTFITRIAGFVILERVGSLHPRVYAGLNAVPAAVLSTLFVPPALSHGLPEFFAMALAMVVALRYGVVTVLLFGLAVLLALRYVF